MSQAERIGSAKDLKQGYAWPIGETAGMSMWLQQSEQKRDKI